MTVVGPKNRPMAELTALKEQLQQLEGVTAKSVSAPGPEAPLPKLDLKSQAAGQEDAGPRIQNASAVELEAAIAKAKPQILAQLLPIVQQIEDAKIPADPAKASLAELTAGADTIFAQRKDIDNVYRMLRALPAAIQKAFPMAQLEALEKALKTKQEELEKFEDKLKGSAPSNAPAQSSMPYNFKPQEVKPSVPVLLRPEAMPTLDSAAQKLGDLLSDPGLAGAVLAAAPAGAAGEAYLNAIRSAAMLVDYATGTLDYTKVGENGWGIKDRGAHQARAYGYGDKNTSAPRQDGSRQALHAAIQEALGDKAPTKALERMVTDRFLLEVGIPKGVAQDWKPTFAAVTQALKDELFVPLRAINECLERSMVGYAYQQTDRAKGKQISADMTRAVSEGRFEEWRRSLPENVVQLQALSDPQRQIFFDSLKTQAEFGSRKISTREGVGPDLFWATKTGGPSHGFDVMTRCVMALLTNLRTKVIQVDDASFALPAARAYLKLIDRPDGQKPLLALEGVQFDFGYFGDKGGVKTQIFTHAAQKAKEMGLELIALSFDYHGVGGAMGGIKEGQRSALIHPVVLLEASDYMGNGHDGPIRAPDKTTLRGLIYSP